MMFEKFKLAIKKEFFIYVGMFLLLTLIAHSDILSNPFFRFQMMYEKGNYTHPFLYTFLLYSLLFVLRKILDFILGLFGK